MEGCSQEASAEKGDSVSSASWDLGQESMPAQLPDEATDASTTGAGLSGIGGRGGPELVLQVTVAESIDEVVARQDGLEQSAVGLGDGIETCEVLSKMDTRTAE